MTDAIPWRKGSWSTGRYVGHDREKSGFHASGHIHGLGIEEMVETIRSEMLIPVHTKNREFFQRFEGICRVVYPQKGESIALG